MPWKIIEVSEREKKKKKKTKNEITYGITTFETMYL